MIFCSEDLKKQAKQENRTPHKLLANKEMSRPK
jgi:hypothetical protein